MSVIEVFDKSGFLLGEVVADASREWGLNGYGGRTGFTRCAFSLAVIDSRIDVGWFEYGNLVLIRHPKLPWWAGVIEPPRAWDEGVLKVTAYGAEYMLSRRRGNSEKILKGTPGDYFNAALQMANTKGDTLISAGAIERAGKARENKYDFATIAEGVNQIKTQFNQDWDVTPAIAGDGRLYFLGNWYEKRGAVIDFTLEDGWNLEAVNNYTEQGVIINDLEGIGDGVSSTSRLRAEARDDNSISQYGLHQGRENFDAKTTSGLQGQVDERLKQTAHPRRVFDVSAADVDETWNNLRIGNTLNIRLSTLGMTGGRLGIATTVRIVGMTFDEERGVVDLTCDEER